MKPRIINQEVGLRLKKYRLEKANKILDQRDEVSLTRLAEELGVSPSSLSNWESGKTKISNNGLGKLENFYDISRNEILFGDFRNYIRLVFTTPTFSNAQLVKTTTKENSFNFNSDHYSIDENLSLLITDTQLEIIYTYFTEVDKTATFGDYNEIIKFAVNYSYLPLVTDETDLKKIVSVYGKNILFQLSEEIFNQEFENIPIDTVVNIGNMFYSKNESYPIESYKKNIWSAQHILYLLEICEEKETAPFFQVQKLNATILKAFSQHFIELFLTRYNGLYKKEIISITKQMNKHNPISLLEPFK